MSLAKKVPKVTLVIQDGRGSGLCIGYILPPRMSDRHP